MTVTDIVQRLLACAEAGDGVEEAELARAEQRLGGKIPPALRDFYLLAGKNVTLADSFNHFALPEQLQVKDDKVLFLEENQGACFWGVETGEANPMVFMYLPEEETWRPEMPLAEFMAMALYYQCAQGGYDFCGVVGLGDSELRRMVAEEWDTVVERNGLFVAWKQDCLLWYLFDEQGNVVDKSMYVSARTRAAYDAHETAYDLAEL